jgi:integrase
MNTVEPIRELRDIKNMKRALEGRDRLLFIFGINSGLRISDILNLRIGDVMDDFGRPRDYVEVKEKKTGKSKRFRLNDSIRTEIKRQVSGMFDQYLFKSRKGDNKAISRVQAYRIIQRAADKVGLEDVKIGTHSMRKTFGYHAYNNGTPLERLQIIFNHSSPNETLGYIGITQEEVDEVYVAMNL